MNDSLPTASSESDGMNFEIAVLEDVSRAADVFWRNWLWRRRQPGFGPSPELLARFEGRYGTGGIVEAWSRWFEVLTSFDYADAVLGHDVRMLFNACERGMNGIRR